MAKDENPAAGLETRMIPVALISDPQFNSRSYREETATHNMAASLREYGQKQPIVVRPIKPRQDGNGNTFEYELIIGSRRVAATRLNGAEMIWAAIKPTTDKQAKIDNIIENLQREDLSSYDRARSFNDLATVEKLSNEEICQITGYGSSRVFALISQFQNMPPALKTRWENRDPIFTPAFLEAIDRIQVPELKEKFYKQRKALALKSNKDPEGEELLSQDEYAALLKERERNEANGASAKQTITVKTERYAKLKAGILKTRQYSKDQKDLAIQAIDYLMDAKIAGIAGIDVTTGTVETPTVEVVPPTRRRGRPAKSARN